MFETDKSKRFSCDTSKNYKLLGEVHTRDDEIIDVATKNSFGKHLNAHAENVAQNNQYR